MSRRKVQQWALRQQDWSDPVIDCSSLVAKASGSDEVVRAVALVDEGEKDTLLTLFRGSGKSHALLLVEISSGLDTASCPGAVGSKLVFKQVKFTRGCTPGLDPPGPKAKAPGAKLDVVKNEVVFVRFLQRYMEKEAWSAAAKQPQRAFLEVVAKHHVKVLDSWGWLLEGVAGGPTQQVFGKCRLAAKDVQTLLAASGQGGVFFEPCKSYDMPAVTTEWCPQGDQETPGAYLKRCLAVAADFGLTAGRRQIGKRMRCGPGTPIQRVWLVQVVPGAVTVEQITEVLSGYFTDVEMILQRRRGAHKEIFHLPSEERGPQRLSGNPPGVRR